MTDEVAQHPIEADGAHPVRRRASAGRRFGLTSATVATTALRYVFAFVLGAWTLGALFSTSYLPADWQEIPEVRRSGALTVVVGALLLPVLLTLITRWWDLSRVQTRTLLTYGLPVLGLAGLTWVMSTAAAPDADQLWTMEAAIKAAKDDYSAWQGWGYFTYYPHQIGLAWYEEWLVRLAGPARVETMMEVVNVAFAVASVAALAAVAKEMFSSRRVTNLTALLAMFCVPQLLLSAHDYGSSAAILFPLIAIRQVLIFMRRRSWWSLLLGGLAMGFAMMVRNNTQIVLIAIVLTLLVGALRRWRWQNLVAIAVMVALALSPAWWAKSQYEDRSGIPTAQGMPSQAWVVMGMQDGFMAPGWYNRWSMDAWVNTNADREAVKAMAQVEIDKRLAEFKADPGVAREFYAAKFMTQWTDPTFQTLWLARYMPKDDTSGEIGRKLVFGEWRDPAIRWMDHYQSGLLVLALIGFWGARRRWTERQLVLPLMILGGMAFHLLWEAKALYSVPYFFATVPLAALGADTLARWVHPLLRFNREKH